MENLARRIVANRWLAIAATVTLVLACGTGLQRLEQTADYRVYFDPGAKDLQASEALQDTYSRSDNLLFVLSPKDGNVFTAAHLKTVYKLTEQAWQLPHSTRVDSITNFQHSYADDDTLNVEHLVSDPARLSSERIADVRSIALNEPRLINRLISEDGGVTGVNVTINLPDGEYDSATREVVAYARELMSDFRAENPDIRFDLTGVVMMNNAFPEASEKDSATLIPLMFVVVIGGLLVFLRSWQGTVGTVLVLLFSIVSGMGLAGWLGIKLSPGSASAPIIILTVAVADAVHLLMGYLQQLRNGDTDRTSALAKAGRANISPILLTSVSTAVGFLSLNFSDSPPFRDLGNIVAMGVIAALLYTLIFLPAFMSLMPLPRKGATAERKGTDRVNRLAESLIAHRNAVLVASALVSAGVTALVPLNELNDNFVEYFDESFAVRRATDYTIDNLTGVHVIEYSVPAGGPQQVANPEYMHHLDQFAEWYRQQPEVVHVATFTDIIKRLNQRMHDDAPSTYRIPDDQGLAAQYLLLYELSLPYGLDLTNEVNLDKSATRLSVTLHDVTNKELLGLEKRAAEWSRAHLPANMQVRGVGWSMMFAGIAQRNIVSMLTGTFYAVLTIVGVLMLWFRSIRLGLFTLLPNLLPALMAFGLWGLFVGEIGLAASVITAMTLGLIVDDTIHFINRYVRHRTRDGLSPEDAIRASFDSVGRALIVTTIVLVAGFSVLAASKFHVNGIIGMLSALTAAIALAMDLTMLPTLLMRFDSWLLRAAAPTPPRESAPTAEPMPRRQG